MTKFPARFKHDDLVDVDFGDAGSLEGGRITRVSFTDSKVLYDIIVTTETVVDETTTDVYTFTLNNVPSYYVQPAEVLSEEEI